MKVQISREAISKIAIGIVFTIVVSCIATKTYSNAQILKELKGEIGSTVQASTETYLKEYVVESGLIPNDTIMAMSNELSSGVTKVLKNKNFTEEDVSSIDSSVEDVMNKYIDNLNISDEEKKILKQNIMALVMSSVLQSMIDKTYVTQDTLDLVQNNFDAKILDVEKSIEKQQESIDVSLAKVERMVSLTESKTANINEMDSLNAKLESLKSGNADKATIDSLMTDIKKLQDKEAVQDSSLTTLNNSLSQLSFSLSRADAGQTTASDKLKSQIEEAQKSLQTKIDQNVSDLAALKLEMEDEIKALNKSVSTDVTAQITALQTSLDNTSTTLNSRVTTAENNVAARLEENKIKIDTAMAEMNDKLTTGQEKLDTLTSNYNQYMTDIGSKKQDAVDKIAADLGTKTTSGARYDIEQDKLAALGNIETGRSDALDDIEEKRQSAVSSVQNIYETDISDINTRIDNISEDLDANGYGKVNYWDETDGTRHVRILGAIEITPPVSP